MPERRNRLVRPGERAIRGEQRPSAERRLARGLPEQFRCSSDVFVRFEAIATQHRDRGVLPDA